MALFHPAIGIFIKLHPGSISIWGKTIPQKNRTVVRPESNNNSIFKPKMITTLKIMRSIYKGD
jgi:hypothetical protein